VLLGYGKANQYFLRGFNLDHGTDLATRVDGAPVNMPTHAHGQGYSDINFRIPELLEMVAYRKGPYYAEEGDFSAAGSVDLRYRTRLPRTIYEVTGASTVTPARSLRSHPASQAGPSSTHSTILRPTVHGCCPRTTRKGTSSRSTRAVRRHTAGRSRRAPTTATGPLQTRPRCARSSPARSTGSASSIPPTAATRHAAA